MISQHVCVFRYSQFEHVCTLRVAQSHWCLRKGRFDSLCESRRVWKTLRAFLAQLHAVVAFIAARKLYFKHESYSSFLRILYSLEKLPWHAYLELPSRLLPFRTNRLEDTLSFLCLCIPSSLHWYIAVFKDFTFSYILYCARCHVNVGHSWKGGHLSSLRVLKTARGGQIDIGWPQMFLFPLPVIIVF